MRRISRWPVNSPHKIPVTRKKFPFDDVIMWWNRALRETSSKLQSRNRVNMWSFLSVRCDHSRNLWRGLSMCSNQIKQATSISYTILMWRHSDRAKNCHGYSNWFDSAWSLVGIWKLIALASLNVSWYSKHTHCYLEFIMISIKINLFLIPVPCA